MKEQDQELLKKVLKGITGYWSETDAIANVPILFPFVEPKEHI